jgi:oligopeptide transport system substrate-binding protein
LRAARLICLFALVLAGCLKRETAVQRGNREQILYLGIGGEAAELDPQLAVTLPEASAVSALFEGLVTEDPHDLHPVPGVAARWDVSPDGRTYTFFLRGDARWSDGHPVTARDFVFSWRRILTPSLAADNANLLYILQGAEAFHQGTERDFDQVGVRAIDAHTLRVTLEHPAPYFLSLLTHWAWDPVPKPTLAAEGPLYQRGNRWAREGHLVGNGPFRLKTWRPDHVMILEKSATYWDARTVRLQALHFFPIESVEAEERAYRAGQLHLTSALPVSRIEANRRERPQEFRADPYLATYFYRFNIRRPYLSDPRIRRALALAIDRQAIADKVLHGGGQPASAFTPPGMEGYVPPPLLATDLTEARRLLAEAGYPNGQGLPAFELLFNNSENHRVIAEAIQEMWRRGLGVQVNLFNQESKVVLSARRSGDYQILRSDWVADYADPRSFLNLWRSGSGNNYTGWSNPDYDALLFAASRAPEPAERNALWRKAETLLLHDSAIIPIYYYTHVFLIQPSVQGWYPTLLDHHPYKYVWLKP